MILDTNVYSALDRGEHGAVDAVGAATVISLPFCVVGELHFGFLLGERSRENHQRLTKFLSLEQVEILYPSLATTEIYGELSTYCRRHGRSLSHNDLWIAALAIEHDFMLATYDQDFEVLTDRLGDRLNLLSN